MCVSCSVTSDFMTAWTVQPARLLCPWDFPGKDTRVGCQLLFQGIFLTQGSNPHLLHWQAHSLPLSHPYIYGSPYIYVHTLIFRMLLLLFLGCGFVVFDFPCIGCLIVSSMSMSSSSSVPFSGPLAASSTGVQTSERQVGGVRGREPRAGTSSGCQRVWQGLCLQSLCNCLGFWDTCAKYLYLT